MLNGLNAININSSEKEDDERKRLSLEELKAFIDSSPSLKELKKSINFVTPKEQMIYLLLIIILSSYIKLFKVCPHTYKNSDEIYKK